MTDADKLKHDFLTCPLCLELFKEPKVLDCQHTYCLACLQQYLASQQTISSQCICPVCKEPTEIPTNDVRRLRNNFLVSGLVDFTTSQNQQNGNNNMPAELPGTQCPACEEPKDCEAFCRQCEMWLCASCTRSHGKLPATRDHAVMSLMDINTEGMIDDVLTQLCEETDARYDAVLQQCQQVSDQVHKASTQINASAECVRAMVEEKREELLMQLTRLMSGVEDQLNQVLVEVEGRKSQIDQARAKVREARGSANAMLVMRTVQELQQNVRHLPPLRDVPAGLKSASGVQFHQGHSLLSVSIYM
ncbi:hypothetical protein BaRGS_00024785 [Batillaria attramentaria]|uniref:Uncharacterized protein n=1 Tax=Batillaria attramentaria TaxID=370345 RepID=A0ABD0K9V3_9CAEN